MGEILVTGANGFVGSHICEALLDAGYRVRALVRKTSDLTNIDDLDISLVYGDLNDPESLGAAVDGVEAVINNAGLTKTNNVFQFDSVNVDGTINMLSAVQKVNPGIKRFVQISSAAASGSADSLDPIDEDRTPRPLTAYGRSKLGGEKAVGTFNEAIPSIILRPTAVYGPRDKDMLSFFKIIKYGLKPTFGTGECYTNFTYVRDLGEAAVKAVGSDVQSGSIYFVAEERFYSFSEAADIISGIYGNKAIDIHIPVWFLKIAGWLSETTARVMRKPSIFTREKAIEISQKYWLLDTSKIKKEMGFVCRTSFKDGAAETVDWYRRHKWL